MKNKYLNEIKTRLEIYNVSDSELNDIIADYDQMYNDGIEKGLKHEAIVDYLGSPEKIVKELSENYSLKTEIHESKRNRIVALMPFITTATYMLLGFLLNAWHPGWLVFLLIPVTAILVNVREKGFVKLTSLSPFIAVTTFILLGTYLNAWNPGWLVFFIIPIFGVLTSKNLWKIIGFISMVLITSGIYLYVGYTTGFWGRAALAFILLFVYAVVTNEVHFSWSFKKDKNSTWIKITVLATIALYFLFGYFFNTWAYLWMLFLLVPMVAIITNVKDKNKIVALMPFISTIIFFCLGFFFGWWALSWLAFLLIPAVAILVNA